jgi:hypothetical protein
MVLDTRAVTLVLVATPLTLLELGASTATVPAELSVAKNIKRIRLMSRKVTFEFPDDETAMTFAHWMCDGTGEQDYWLCCEEAGRPMVRFHYHGEEDETKDVSDPERYGPFMGDWTIRCTPMEHDKKVEE